MTIHSENPFAETADAIRRFRGRLGGAVSLWTAGKGAERAGLTVSSLMVANGDPGAVLGLLDPDSDLLDRLEETGRGIVQLLAWADRDLAEAFGGTGPAPGGPFRLGIWEQTSYGPVLAGRSHALVRLLRTEDLGWSKLAITEIVGIEIIEVTDPLEHRRGRYRQTPG